MVTKIELTTWSILKTLFILIGAWLLWQIREIVTLLFVVLILVAALKPSVQWFVERRIPRIAAVSLLLVAIISGIILILALILPAVVEQLQTFIQEQIPHLLERLTPYYDSLTQGREVLGNIITQLQSLSGNIVAGVVVVFGGLLSALTILVLTFYLLLEEQPLREAGLNLLPEKYREQLIASLERITDKLGAWLRGQFTLSITIGVLTAVGMSLIGVPAPLAIGLLAGLFEIIPIVGPMLAGVVMVVMAATTPEDTLLKIALAVIFFLLIQFLESHILVPKVMQQAIGLSPVIVIIALLIGSTLAGVPGAILAVPLAAIIQVVAEDWPKFRLVRSRVTSVHKV